MDAHRPPGFDDPGSASLWAWLFGRRPAGAARVRPPAPAGWPTAPARTRPPAAPTAPPSGSRTPNVPGLTLGWDPQVGATRASLVVRPDLTEPRAVRTDLDRLWGAMLHALGASDQGGQAASGPVVVTVWIADRQLGDDARAFLDGVRENPGSGRVRAVEVQRVTPPASSWPG